MFLTFYAASVPWPGHVTMGDCLMSHIKDFARLRFWMKVNLKPFTSAIFNWSIINSKFRALSLFSLSQDYVVGKSISGKWCSGESLGWIIPPQVPHSSYIVKHRAKTSGVSIIHVCSSLELCQI